MPMQCPLHQALLFRDVSLTPEKQYVLTKLSLQQPLLRHATPNLKTSAAETTKHNPQKKSILHPDLKTIPRVETAYIIRFYRWHIDAALYDLSPPPTTLHAIRVPQGPKQIVRYDDGTGDELSLPLGTTAFVSDQTMFQLLPSELKSLAVRTKVKYAPHPYSEGLEMAFDELPPWSGEKIKVYPVLWKNPVTKALSFQVHPKLIINPLPAGIAREGALHPDGAHITDLKEVRELLYKMQRPAIAPSLVYPHDWHEKDLVLFHNRGILHSVVGAFTPDQVRMFHQCNLAASDNPIGSSDEDIIKWA
ncbi:Clavaminate synthase-like protein [Gymnopus androsaceus JB14]|uniref:Clavaminate synthase-like protein n=1 Tax=Gymnopus androsaceus JB14 TaxID=1447944 RepID=A0A6A4I9R2_9AGAR|nr:Clavaminate synthase-like protein [Gymnopus androsaceus JB14]